LFFCIALAFEGHKRGGFKGEDVLASAFSALTLMVPQKIGF